MRKLTKAELERLKFIEVPMQTAYHSQCIYLMSEIQRKVVIEIYNALLPDYAAVWGSEKAHEGSCQRCWLQYVTRIAEVYYNQKENAVKVHQKERNNRQNRRG